MDGDADDPRLTPRERAALKFASQFWDDHHGVDDELWSQLTEVFSPSEVVELGMSVGQAIAMGKLVAMLGVPNPDFRGHLPDDWRVD
jgi:alkylhydroperoxidase family enzyme